jgi:hypothetical protein
MVPDDKARMAFISASAGTKGTMEKIRESLK